MTIPEVRASIEDALTEALAHHNGILRLEPAWVARDGKSVNW
jgi:hypothetical protein